MKVYDDVSQALWPDCMDWLVTKHPDDIRKLYEKLFCEYLQEKFGRMEVDKRQRLVKSLMKNIIS